MAQLKPTKTVYTVSDFLERQRSHSLVLKPFFQRGQVWSGKAKSLLIDTVAKGLPIPIILLREIQDLKTLKRNLEVIDGQQRLRTMLSFIDPSCVPDFNRERDTFLVLKEHNEELSGTPFQALSEESKREILGYELSVHIFPPETSDSDVLLMFSRLNSTGLSLNAQELRNAGFYGAFKTLVYRLALRYLNQWRKWRVFSEQDIARMIEVENVSDYVLAMLDGIQGKSQKRINQAYQEYDDAVPNSKSVEARFDKVIEEIDRVFGEHLPTSVLHSQALFYSLFTASYDYLYGLNSDLKSAKTARKFPAAAADNFINLSRTIESKQLPESVQSAFGRSTTDVGRRRQRHQYFLQVLGFGTA